jgi:lysophospholipase L1-like esterase
VADCDITTDITSLSCPQKEKELAEITFSGSRSITIDAGNTIVSDSIPLRVTAGATLCVNLYFSDFTLMQSAVLITGPLSKGYFSMGDMTCAAELPHLTTKTTNWFYFLSNIDIMTDSRNHVLICYGDSITAQSWPDYLTLRLRAMGDTHTSVIRRAASGTRILRQYDCITYDSYGLKGSNRFHHEIPTAGAKAVIIQQGINDIIHPVGVEVNEFRPMSDLPAACDLIEGLKWYIEEAHKLGLQAYLGTLLPIYGWRTYAPFREQLKNEVNEWIRNNKDADGCIDFDVALRDAKNPTAFHDGYDSGDHLHPNNTAYKVMAETVPLELMD